MTIENRVSNNTFPYAHNYWTILQHLIFFLLLLFCSSASLASTNNIKMVVTAAFVSESGLPVYEDLAEYISKKLSKNVNIVSGISYDESNLLLDQGIIQVGFVCGLPYIATQTLLAIPVFGVIIKQNTEEILLDEHNHWGASLSQAISSSILRDTIQKKNRSGKDILQRV